MYHYGRVSSIRLSTCDDRWVAIFNYLITQMDVTILEGERGEYKQYELFRLGKSKVQWPDSKHNVEEEEKAKGKKSLAIDAALYFAGAEEKIKWEDAKTFCYFAGRVMGVAKHLYPDTHFRWGGDWNENMDTADQKFHDLVHFEIVE